VRNKVLPGHDPTSFIALGDNRQYRNTVGIGVKSVLEYTPFMAVLGQIFQKISLLGNCVKALVTLAQKYLEEGEIFQ